MRFARESAPEFVLGYAAHHKEQPSLGAFGSYEPAASPAPTRSPPPSYGAQPTPAADPFTDPYDVAEAKAEDLYVEACVEINLNRRVNLRAVDAPPARWRGGACLPPTCARDR